MPLVLLGAAVTVFFGVFLAFYLAGRIAGGRPDPGLADFVVVWIILGTVPLLFGGALLGRSRFAIRFWLKAEFLVLVLFLVVGADGNFGPTNWRTLTWREKLPGTSATDLKRTIVTPHLETEIAPGKNVLWCGTFQLAWNEACQLTGGDLQFNQDSPLVTVLNKHSFTKDSLDEGSYVAMAGFVKDNIHAKIQQAVREKFRGSFEPRFLPDPALTPHPNDIAAYACFYKHLTFPLPFERLDDALTFGGVKVPAFGMAQYKASLEKLYPQVLILDYQNSNDFVIELKTTSEGDRLILAKTQPNHDLAGTVTGVENRLAAAHPELAETNDLLCIPKFNFDLTREYSEIEGLRLVPKSHQIATNLVLVSAVQNTKFDMDEKGVELKSESEVSIACAQRSIPVSKHVMIIDQPFLILMQRSKAKIPYFALWVDNPEILVSWK